MVSLLWTTRSVKTTHQVLFDSVILFLGFFFFSPSDIIAQKYKDINKIFLCSILVIENDWKQTK